ncbi:HAD family hydrolase [Carboxylicivirga linearis]|uniref:HAD-IA family hydrolase n=1 Tax=Carboxylicivirga linearis TaxID=1628157 RepID=A0ABS5JZ60_9BACT|nr:HAD-IA family hydrolase [Carboxylicivirga linearis]MBS2100192.1 HAD-IA family hydrolase [Carboxylicivirga linearis]
MIPETIKAVFFDMDGVLYDSMPNHEYTWRESMKTVEIDFPAEEAYMNEGRPGFSTIKYAFDKFLNRPATEQDIDKVYGEKTRLMKECPEAPILPGMQELIAHLKAKGVNVFVVTGSKQPTLVDKLDAHFGVAKENIISGRDVKQGKPHPEPYLIALEKSGLEKEQCIVVENAPLGVESAKAAGIYTIAVNTGKLKDQVLLDAGADQLFANTQLLSDELMK